MPLRRLLHPLCLLVLSSLLAAACGQVVEPEPFTMPPSTQPPEATSGASSVEAPPLADATSEVTLVPPNFVPQRTDDYLPEVLVATDGELLSAGLGAEATILDGRFAGQQAVRAVDDLLGGLVVQRQGEAGDVVWLSATEEEQLLVADAQLFDVGYARAAYAVVLVDSGLEQIRLVDLERTPLIDLADDEEVLALSSSGGLNAVALSNEQCGELRFFDVEGSTIDLPAPGEPQCPVPRRPYFTSVALSPDGGAVAYTIVTYRDDGLENATELFVLDLATGTVYNQRKIGEDGDRITSLTFDGDRVAYIKTDAESETVNVLQVADGAQERTIEVSDAGGGLLAVSFARLPLAEG